MISLCALNSIVEDLGLISFARDGIALAALLAQRVGYFERIDLALLPPLSFPTGGVDMVVVDGAKRHGELIADLQAEPS